MRKGGIKSMSNTGLNKFDWITAGIGLATVALGIAGTVFGWKAGQIRTNEMAEAYKRITPPQPQTTSTKK
jgi:hypothetical protein